MLVESISKGQDVPRTQVDEGFSIGEQNINMVVATRGQDGRSLWNASWPRNQQKDDMTAVLYFLHNFSIIPYSMYVSCLNYCTVSSDLDGISQWGKCNLVNFNANETNLSNFSYNPRLSTPFLPLWFHSKINFCYGNA